MLFSKLVTTAAFVQGALSYGIKTYTGRDCTGQVQETTLGQLNVNSCSAGLVPFQSYRENGWGPHNVRVAFYKDGACSPTGWLYDTWAYDGDYFHSGQCYNIDGHSPNGQQTAQSVESYKKF